MLINFIIYLFLKAAELITFPHFRAVVKQIRLSNNGKLVGVKVIQIFCFLMCGMLNRNGVKTISVLFTIPAAMPLEA